jgi:hypothetical protein
MRWTTAQHLSKSQFKRSTGVTPEVFHLMVKALEEAKAKSRKHPSRGVPSKLCIEDKILLLLMYYREYRTMFHIGIDYGISESAVCKIIMDTEKKLINDTRFHLPGKKALTKQENTFEVIWIDVSETPVERPKKNNGNITVARRKDIPLNRR